MDTKLNPTYTIYKSNNISFECLNDNRYVKAINDIAKGDVLLIEHGLYDDIKDDYNILTNTLLYNKKFYEEVYPRNDPYNFEDIINSDTDDSKTEGTKELLASIISMKLEKNIFKHTETDKDYYTLLRDGIIFNHSKEPNANYHNLKIEVPYGIMPIMIFYFVAYKDIKAGEEICINYGNDYFKENIDLNEYNNKQDKCFKNYKDILNKINNYISTIECNDVMFCHNFMRNGLVYIPHLNKEIVLPNLCCLLNGIDDGKTSITMEQRNNWVITQMYLILSTLETKYKKLRKIAKKDKKRID
jgi:hypothetical protein